ncbi:MAG: N-acetylglucosamine-6-phosphate deacetylase [Actinomycetota bacterium]
MKTMRLGVSSALVDGVLIEGDVETARGEIVAVGVAPPAGEHIAIPGYIDLQVNGFAGVDFLSCDVDGYRVAGEALVARGVTSYQPTLVSSPPEVTTAALEVAAKAQIESVPRILGVHLEGPFIAPAWKGAHDERYIVGPDLELASKLCNAGPVTYMTIAPEPPGGFELLDWLLGRGIIVSLGHSDADAPTAHAAYNRGARAVTHLHNAQRRFAARDPGISAVALTRGDVVVQVIADLIHLAPETLLIAWRCARDRLVLVTDAIAAATVGPGEYRLGDRLVYVSDDAARLADGTLAGSLLTMDRAVRNLAGLGVPWPEAVHAATTTPARLIGRDELGTLRPGSPADVAVLADDLSPVRTIVSGREVWAAPSV